MHCAIARMAKLADAADLKSAGRKAVGVQIPLRAPSLHQSTSRLSPQLARRLDGGLPCQIAHPWHTLLFAARSAQLHRQANGTSPGVITKKWSQLFMQVPFTLDPAHSIALALFTFHVISLRNGKQYGTHHHINHPNRPKGQNIHIKYLWVRLFSLSEVKSNIQPVTENRIRSRCPPVCHHRQSHTYAVRSRLPPRG